MTFNKGHHCDSRFFFTPNSRKAKPTVITLANSNRDRRWHEKLWIWTKYIQAASNAEERSASKLLLALVLDNHLAYQCTPKNEISFDIHLNNTLNKRFRLRKNHKKTYHLTIVSDTKNTCIAILVSVEQKQLEPNHNDADRRWNFLTSWTLDKLGSKRLSST